MFATGEGLSLPAKRRFTERVKAAAIMIVVAFILLLDVDEAKIYRIAGAEQRFSIGSRYNPTK